MASHDGEESTAAEAGAVPLVASVILMLMDIVVCCLLLWEGREHRPSSAALLLLHQVPPHPTSFMRGYPSRTRTRQTELVKLPFSQSPP